MVARKQPKGRKGNQKPYFDKIPNELIITIVARVASSSIADLHNAKLSCKSLMRICDDNYVLKHATLEKFPVIPWLKGTNTSFQMSFVELCQKNGNPEALYRKGVVDYFKGGRMDDAVECLKAAHKSGHVGASYAIGIILILGGEKQKGTRHLVAIKKDKNRAREVKKGRKILKKILGSMWIENEEIAKERPPCCSSKYHHMYRKRGWSLFDDDEYVECETCLCDNEISCIYDSMIFKF